MSSDFTINFFSFAVAARTRRDAHGTAGKHTDRMRTNCVDDVREHK